MSTRNLDRIFRPDRIALLGAEDRPGNPGLHVLGNLLAERFHGVVYVIDPKNEALRGIPTFSSLSTLPKVPDLAIICSPADEVADIVHECGHAGVRGLIIMSRGSGTSPESGNELDRQVAEAAQQYEEMRIIGPNSLGLILPRDGLNASHATTRPKRGHLAFISESRALCNAVIDWATDQGIGFSCFLSIGQRIDVGLGDVIDYLSRDPDTRAIIICLGNIVHAREFLSAARAFARNKPIVVYKAGRFERSAELAALHAGGLVAEDSVYAAAFARAGVVRVTEFDEVFDVAELLASKRLPLGARLAIVGNAGGPAVTATDALLARGGELAQLAPETVERLHRALPPVGSHVNPVDLLDSASPARFVKAIQTVLEDNEVDAVLVIFASHPDCDPLATAKVVAEVSEVSTKPILAAWMGGARVKAGIQLLNEAGLATHATPEQAVRAFMHLVSYSRNLSTLYETPREFLVRAPTERKRLRDEFGHLFSEPGAVLHEEQAKALLGAYGINVATSLVARSQEEAVACAETMGYPVVLKVRSSRIVKRSDVGGVALDLRDSEAVLEAYCRMDLLAKEHGETDPAVTITPMIAHLHSHEMILGSKVDPTFGVVVIVGMGGIGATVHLDHSIGLPPLNERLARQMVESLPSWRLLSGYRGRPSIDRDALLEAIVRFSYLVTDFPEIAEFDVNPILALPDGAVALDASAIVRQDSTVEDADSSGHLAIRPYPEHDVRVGQTSDGVPVTLRPVRQEDEPLWHELIGRSSQRSIRFRFRSLIAAGSHEMAVQYCAIDYGREISIVAECSEGGRRELIGIAQMTADEENGQAEFAVLVSDPWQRRGVGSLLLDHCLDLAQRWGITTAIAETDPKNRGMLRLFSTRGFSSEFSHEDDTVYLKKALGS